MSESNYSKLLALGIPLKRNTGQTKTTCPRCSHLREPANRREQCLSVDIDAGKYTCWNAPCDFRGNVNYDPNRKPQKTYVRPVWTNITQLSNGLVQYWADRGISQQTLIKMQLQGWKLEWMPYPGYEIPVMMFPYFRKGEIVNIKFRGSVDTGEKNEDGTPKMKKAFRQVTDAEKIFYNIDAIESSEECTITEGEPDTISYVESGYEFAVSVPNGATIGSNNLTYLDNSIEYFENKKKIYIGVDNDEAGRSLQAELIRRLGAERCWIINYQDCKDANAYMVKYGKIALMELFKWAKPAKLSGIIDIDDVWSEVLDIWQNGLQPGALVNVKDVDEHLSFPAGFFTIWTGRSNSGKSPFLRYLLVRLAVIHGYKTAFFSPEDEPVALHIINIVSLLIGKTFNPKYGNKISVDEVNSAKQFIKEHFYFISKGKPTDNTDLILKDFTVVNILGVAKKLVFRHGINYLVIDPWNRIKHYKSNEHWNEKKYISDQLDLIEEFATENVVGVHLVAHPTKIYKDQRTGKYPIVMLGDIAGAGEFESKPAIGVSGERDYIDNVFRMHVLKMKHNHLGQIGTVTFVYDYRSGRFNVKDCIPDKGNWLVGAPLSQGYNEPSSVVSETPIVTNDIPDDNLPF